MAEPLWTKGERDVMVLGATDDFARPHPGGRRAASVAIIDGGSGACEYRSRVIEEVKPMKPDASK